MVGALESKASFTADEAGHHRIVACVLCLLIIGLTRQHGALSWNEQIYTFFFRLDFFLVLHDLFSGVYNLQPDYDKIDGKAHYIKMTSTQRRHLFFDASRK